MSYHSKACKSQDSRGDQDHHVTSSIKTIQTFLKKKKLTEAKSTFVQLLYSMRDERQKSVTKYTGRFHWKILLQLGEIYMKLGIASRSYFTSDTVEWSAVCFLGWLHWRNDEKEKGALMHDKNTNFGEKAKPFFKKWYSLFVNGIKRKQNLQEYRFYYEDTKDYFVFLELSYPADFERGLQAVNGMLKHFDRKSIIEEGENLIRKYVNRGNIRMFQMSTDMVGYLLSLKSRFIAKDGDHLNGIFYQSRFGAKERDYLKAMYYLQEAIKIHEMQQKFVDIMQKYELAPLPIRRIIEVEVYYKNLHTYAKFNRFEEIGRKEASLKHLLKLYQKVNSEEHKIPKSPSSLDMRLYKEYCCVKLRNLYDIASSLIEDYGDEEEGQKFLKLGVDLTKKAPQTNSMTKDIYFAMFNDLTNQKWNENKAALARMKLESQKNPMVHRIESAIKISLDLSTSMNLFDKRQDFGQSIGSIQRAMQQIGDLKNVYMKVKTDLYFKACFAVYEIYVTNYPMHLEAIDIMKSVLSLLPPYQKRAKILLAIAQVYRQCNYFKKSLKYAKKADELSNDFKFVSGPQFKPHWKHLNDAFCHFGLKEYELAVLTFKQVNATFKDFYEDKDKDLWSIFAKNDFYLVYVVTCFIKLKQYKNAIETLELRPSSSSPCPTELVNKILLLISYQQMGRKIDLTKQRQKVDEALLELEEEALWVLYDCLDGLAEYYDDLSFNIMLVQKRELIEPQEAPKVFMLSKNSFFIKQCFKNKITLAKNLK